MSLLQPPKGSAATIDIASISINIKKKPNKQACKYSISVLLVGDQAGSLLERVSHVQPTPGVCTHRLEVPVCVPFEEPLVVPNAMVMATAVSEDSSMDPYRIYSMQNTPVLVLTYDCRSWESYDTALRHHKEADSPDRWRHMMVVLFATNDGPDGKVPHADAKAHANKAGWLFFRISATCKYEDLLGKFSRMVTAALERRWPDKEPCQIWKDCIEPAYVLYDYIS